LPESVDDPLAEELDAVPPRQGDFVQSAVPVALSLIRGNYQADSFGPIMAGAVISAIPLLVVFLVANRQIIEGVQFSGLKM